MAPKLKPDNAQLISELLREECSRISEEERSDSYKFAFADQEFLTGKETRGIRFQLELLKADVVLREHNIDHTVVVFGSARIRSKEYAENMLANANSAEEKKKAQALLDHSQYYESARHFGRLIAEHALRHKDSSDRLHICTGGGPGIMEAANRGAWEAGGLSIGFNISLPHEQEPNPYLTPDLCFRFHYFALRKMHFLMRARAIVAYPGGFGSFDELFEVLTLVQTRKIDRIPIVLVGKDFWNKLVNFEMLESFGLIDASDRQLIDYADTAEDAWSIIREFYELEHGHS